MARYRKIEVRMWSDERFRALSPMLPSGQALWIYLLTNAETTNVPGLYRSGEAGMAEALGWPLEAFREAFREVSREGMAEADWQARLVWIPNAIRVNTPESPNVVRGWKVAWEELPECDLKAKAFQALKDFTEAKGKAFAEAFGEAFGEALPESRARAGAGTRAGTRAGRSKALSVCTDASAAPPALAVPTVADVTRTLAAPEAVVAAPMLAVVPESPGSAESPETARQGDSRENAGIAPRAPRKRHGDGRAEAQEASANPAELQAAWNEHADPALPRWREMTDRRRKAAAARLRERPMDGDEGWLAVIARISGSAFCRGQSGSGSWVASPDWLLQPDTAAKVLEGKYDDRKQVRDLTRGRVDAADIDRSVYVVGEVVDAF